MRTILTALFVLGLAAAPDWAAACTPAPDHMERWQHYEDQELLRATIVYRGVIENIRRDQSGETILDIRRDNVLLGSGAPTVIHITTEYFAQCAEGNLHFVVQETDYPSRLPDGVARPPRIVNGVGVTILGRPEDADLPSRFTILVDGFEDTQRVLQRFEELRGTQ